MWVNEVCILMLHAFSELGHQFFISNVNIVKNSSIFPYCLGTNKPSEVNNNISWLVAKYIFQNTLQQLILYSDFKASQ